LRRSKLETCLVILEVLANDGPLKISHIIHKADVNYIVLKNYFDFLIRQGAVEKRCVGRDRIVYAITERGLYLIRCLNELNLVIPTGKIRSEIPAPKQRMNLYGMSAKNIANPHRFH
jgi:predicted transcriptional regulator